MSAFLTKLTAQWLQALFVCAGLDTDYEKIPAAFRTGATPGEAILAYNKVIIDAVWDHVGFFKLQFSFYFEHGAEGMWALEQTIAYIKHRGGNKVIIIDAKWGDIGNSNLPYIRWCLKHGVDACTLNLYVGADEVNADGIQPFINEAGLGCFPLVRTSNKGADMIQGLPIHDGVGAPPLYYRVATIMRELNQRHGNCGMVAGATDPSGLSAVCGLAPELPKLVPGFGQAQGGRIEDVFPSALYQGGGIVANFSRGIQFAYLEEQYQGVDPVEAAASAAQGYHEKIQAQLLKQGVTA